MLRALKPTAIASRPNAQALCWRVVHSLSGADCAPELVGAVGDDVGVGERKEPGQVGGAELAAGAGGTLRPRRGLPQVGDQNCWLREALMLPRKSSPPKRHPPATTVEAMHRGFEVFQKGVLKWMSNRSTWGESRSWPMAT